MGLTLAVLEQVVRALIGVLEECLEFVVAERSSSRFRLELGQVRERVPRMADLGRCTPKPFHTDIDPVIGRMRNVPAEALQDLVIATDRGMRQRLRTGQQR